MNQTWQNLGVAAVMEEAVATGLFISLCSIQAPTTGEAGMGSSGAPIGTYTPVTGLQNIVCMDAPQPPSEIKLGANERRSSSEVTADAIRHVLLEAYYPTLQVGWRDGWRAVVTTTRAGITDTFTYDIRGAEPDSQRTQHRLELHLATAGAVQA